MRPAAKIIQILQTHPEHKIMVLCADGSVWWYDVNSNLFTLVAAMDDKGKSY